MSFGALLEVCAGGAVGGGAVGGEGTEFKCEVTGGGRCWCMAAEEAKSRRAFLVFVKYL
ncbi:MAG: hypothetical protein NZ842_08630 [Dehalococcoidia bacterium]|nr:hypothetical protein [Dehalococcoidia bacterium]